MNSFEGRDAMLEEAEFLRGQVERLRARVEELRCRPPPDLGPHERHERTFWRVVLALLWAIGAASALASIAAAAALLG